MAEVATGVLHNVGNVLNSVNVSTTLIREKLQRSEISTLGKVRDLLRQHEADLGAFLTTDPKGKLVPGFIIQLSERLEKEQAALQEEHRPAGAQRGAHQGNRGHAAELRAGFGLPGASVRRQAAGRCAADEHRRPDAPRQSPVIRQYAEVPPLMVDKHKVLQILVNLVHNAKYALDESRYHDKAAHGAASRMNGDDRVKVTVADNGVGIPPENLTRIFSHGFTTRKGGHGFGLHSGANAAKEMGGQLTAHSEGPGTRRDLYPGTAHRTAREASHELMNNASNEQKNRILIIDDNPSIHEDIRKILGSPEENDDRPGGSQSRCSLAKSRPPPEQTEFEIDSAFQGQEGLQKVQEAEAAGRPFALAFVDVRMPPGWDGVETINRIWQTHPHLQVVICTAYSDYSWEEMIRRIGKSDSLVILKKPFDNIEVLQLAHALTEKWHLSHEVKGRLKNLDLLVSQRTTELQSANEQLKKEIAERMLLENALRLSEERFSKAFKASPIPLAIQSLRAGKICGCQPGLPAVDGLQPRGTDRPHAPRS